MSRPSSSWALPAATDAELERRERAEERRRVLRVLGLLTEDGIPVRRMLNRVDLASARAAGIDVDETGRVR